MAAAAPVIALLALGVVGPGAEASTAMVGYRDFSYAGTTAPTADKGQSKLWFYDGRWWGVLFRPTPSGGNFTINRLDQATQTWTDTGVQVDTRSNVNLDARSKGGLLYVAASSPSANPARDRSIKFRRFSYNRVTRTYSPDSGYPVTIGEGQTDGVVIDRDSKGVVWATFVVNGKVTVTHTSGSDAVWVSAYQLPVGAAANVKLEPEGDSSALVHYGGTKIGVMFSNQAVAQPATQPTRFYFAIHVDGTSDQAWTLTTVASGIRVADDHMHLQALNPGDPAGSLLAAVKTSRTSGPQPLVQLFVLRAGTWTPHTFGTVADDHTRPIVQLDSTNRRVYVIAASPCCTGAAIHYKRASLDNMSFAPGKGPLLLQSGTDVNINNPTGTKQNLTHTKGLLVLAGDDTTHRYLHNALPL